VSGLAVPAADASACGVVPLMDAASSVIWVRTVRSCAFVASSIVVALLPEVPVGLPAVPDDIEPPLAADPVSPPIMSVRILSIAAISVPQLAPRALFADADALDAELPDPAATWRSRLFRWVLSCASFGRSLVGSELA